jgi:hypothetical protein
MTVPVPDTYFTSLQAQKPTLCGGVLPPMREPEARMWRDFFGKMLEFDMVAPREMVKADLWGLPAKMTAADLGLAP